MTDTNRDEAPLRELNASIADWEQRRDADAIHRLEEILSRDLVFRRADGTTVGKDEFMAALSKPSPFVDRTSENVTVEERGDRALVTLTVAATKPDGSVGRFRNIRVFFRHDGKWLLEIWFNDDVTDVPDLV